MRTISHRELRKVRAPRRDRPVDLRAIRRVSAPLPSAEIIAGVRGDR